MDILEMIEDWAEEFYPDSVLLQDQFKEGAIKALTMVIMADLDNI